MHHSLSFKKSSYKDFGLIPTLSVEYTLITPKTKEK